MPLWGFGVLFVIMMAGGWLVLPRQMQTLSQMSIISPSCVLEKWFFSSWFLSILAVLVEYSKQIPVSFSEDPSTTWKSYTFECQLNGGMHFMYNLERNLRLILSANAKVGCSFSMPVLIRWILLYILIALLSFCFPGLCQWRSEEVPDNKIWWSFVLLVMSITGDTRHISIKLCYLDGF